MSFEKLLSNIKKKFFKRSHSAHNTADSYDSKLGKAAHIAVMNGALWDSDGSSVYAGSGSSTKDRIATIQQADIAREVSYQARQVKREAHFFTKGLFIKAPDIALVTVKPPPLAESSSFFLNIKTPVIVLVTVESFILSFLSKQIWSHSTR